MTYDQWKLMSDPDKEPEKEYFEFDKESIKE